MFLCLYSYAYASTVLASASVYGYAYAYAYFATMLFKASDCGYAYAYACGDAMPVK